MTSLINKGRKPRFDLHLKIYDLNNLPLANGTSLIKWHLPHSIHGEHRGRTGKAPIANHRVDYNFSKLIPLRITIDKNNYLQECPIEFEVLQEFDMANGGGGGGRDEKITLGFVRLNLAEYVEESEAVARDSLSMDLGRTSIAGPRAGANIPNPTPGSRRRRSTAVGRHHYRHDRTKSIATTSSVDAISPTRHISGDEGTGRSAGEEERVQEGVVRRYLMQESKINSTLKIGILMIQIDGEKNYVAPPLKTAPVFGGIAGIMGEPVEGQEETGQLPTLNKSRDASEHQDMYRRALAASWSCQLGELPAHECIEDIFAGGTGWRADQRKGRGEKPTNDPDYETADDTAEDEGPGAGPVPSPGLTPVGWGSDGLLAAGRASTGGSGPAGSRGDGHGNDEDMDWDGTLKASDISRIKHLRAASGTSDRSSVTVVGPNQHPGPRPHASSDPFMPAGRLRADSDGRRRGGLRSEQTVTPASIVAAAAAAATETSVPESTATTAYASRRETPREGPNYGHGGVVNRSRSESLTSMTTTASDGRYGYGYSYNGHGRQKEVDEFEVREDLVAWRLPGAER